MMIKQLLGIEILKRANGRERADFKAKRSEWGVDSIFLLGVYWETKYIPLNKSLSQPIMTAVVFIHAFFHAACQSSLWKPVSPLFLCGYVCQSVRVGGEVQVIVNMTPTEPPRAADELHPLTHSYKHIHTHTRESWKEIWNSLPTDIKDHKEICRQKHLVNIVHCYMSHILLLPTRNSYKRQWPSEFYDHQNTLKYKWSLQWPL